MNNTYKIANTTLPNYTISGGTGVTSASTIMTLKHDPATLKVEGNVVINGKDLEKRLEIIEKVLKIPERDAKLENKYPKLKKMYNEYIKELSKARMWETLKGEEI